LSFEAFQRILSVSAPLAVTAGIIVGLLNLRNQYRLRQFDTVMRLYSHFGEETFVRHFNRVTNWNYDTYDAYLEKRTEDDHISLTVVTVFFEGMGLLLKRRLAPIDLIDDLLSGPILLAWPKAQPIWVGFRAQYGVPAAAEWFEFLYHAMVRRLAKLERSWPKPRTGPA
jgi:hypothetical protein